MIYHISTVHVSTDTRLQKYLKSSIDMKLICLNRGEKPSGNVIFLMKYSLISRLMLIFLMPFFCFRYINRDDVLVIHDPELILAGFILKTFYRNKIKVNFDAHENILQDIRHKYWLNKYIRNFAYLVFFVIIKYLLPKYDMITTVTTPLVREYSKYNCCVKLLPNLPLSKIEPYESHGNIELFDLKYVYIGSISVQRGIYQILELSKFLKNKILLIGNFVDKKLMADVQSMPEWNNVIYKGYVSNADLSELIALYDVGILFLDDIDTFRDSLPVKIFDYAQQKLIIAWTGSVDAFYYKYVTKFPNVYLGQNFNDLNEAIKFALKDKKVSKSPFVEIHDDWFSIMKEIY